MDGAREAGFNSYDVIDMKDGFQEYLGKARRMALGWGWGWGWCWVALALVLLT